MEKKFSNLDKPSKLSRRTQLMVMSGQMLLSGQPGLVTRTRMDGRLLKQVTNHDYFSNKRGFIFLR
jgi:hypothetical protein